MSTNPAQASSSVSHPCSTRLPTRPAQRRSKKRLCIEVDRHDLTELLKRKPLAAMDLMATLGRQFHSAQRLIRVRAYRNPNEVIEKQATFGERIADSVAGFGGSWTFILSFLFLLGLYCASTFFSVSRLGIPTHSSC